MEDERLKRQLAAAQKTIAALSARVEQQLSDNSGAFGVLAQNVALERLVEAKTAALEAERKKLQDALTQLAHAQSDLMHAGKLECVGRLASGIAHEINTPIQFVSDSLHFLREAAGDVFRVLEACLAAREEFRQEPRFAQTVARLDELEDEADLAYLREHVAPAFERASDGLTRVATLVKSMKEFAHPEATQRTLADLNRALSSTLLVAKSEYKLVADVETRFAPLEKVPCFVGELNQAFLNLIVNAAHAIGDVRQRDGRRGKITVETADEGSVVRVSISDTGTGIPDEVRARVFDPFFTTKAVGQGTGQGLAIARNVVVTKHGGSLTFDTELGRGTTFHIRIPAKPQPAL